MRFKIKPLVLTILAASLLGCNSGTSVGGNPAGEPPSHGQLKQAEIGTIGMLGEPADVKGKAMQENSIPALNPNKIEVTMGPQEIKTNTYVSANSNSIASNLFANVKAGGGFGLFSASLGVEYAKDHQDNSGAVTFISEGYMNYPINISIKVPKEQYLTPEALSYQKEYGDEMFIEEYGSGYVSQIRIGTKFNIIYTLSSNDSATKQALKIAAEASYGSFASFSASIGSMDSEQKKNISKNIKIEINGVTGNIPNLPDCDISNLEVCTTNLLNYSVTYLNGTMSKYEELRKELVSKGTPTLAQFFNTFNASGVGDNSMFGLDLVKFAPYPKIDSDHDEEKEALQNYIIDNISKSAMLSGDSSLMSILKNNDIVSGAIASNPDIKELLNSENIITTYNNSLISTSIMRNILNKCFSGKSVNICNSYLDKKDTLKGSDDQKTTIRNYFDNIVQKFNNNSALKMPGYYSDVIPGLANTFWLAAKDAESRDILIPIDLNDRTANRCKNKLNTTSIQSLSTYKGLETLNNVNAGSVFKDIKNGTLSTEYYATPDDLILYPTYDTKGKITSVERYSKSMVSVTRSNNKYNDRFTCDAAVQRWSPIFNKNVSITKCNDTFGDFNGLNFDNTPTTLLDAISMYRDKPITSRGYHVPSADNICSDAGARTLTVEQPWCSEDNMQCLSLIPTGDLIWKNSANNASENYGKITGNIRSISLSPFNGNGFWKLDGNKPNQISTSMTGWGNAVEIGTKLAKFYSTTTPVSNLSQLNQFKLEFSKDMFNRCIYESYTVRSNDFGSYTPSDYIETTFKCWNNGLYQGNENIIKKVLRTNGKYEINGNSITMSNWRDWEKMEDSSIHAEQFDNVSISDWGHNAGDDLRNYSEIDEATKEINEELEAEGRELRCISIIYSDDNSKPSNHYLKFSFNNSTLRPVPIRYIFRQNSSPERVGTVREMVWKVYYSGLGPTRASGHFWISRPQYGFDFQRPLGKGRYYATWTNPYTIYDYGQDDHWDGVHENAWPGKWLAEGQKWNPKLLFNGEIYAKSDTDRAEFNVRYTKIRRE